MTVLQPRDQVIGALLEDRAERFPDTTFLRFDDTEWSFAEVYERSSNLASGLARLGVRAGDLVPLMMENSAPMALCMFALWKLGAVATPLNSELRGPSLRHAIALAGAETAIVDTELLGAVESVASQAKVLRRVIVGEGADSPGALERVALTALEAEPVGSDLERPARLPSDPAMVLFTSGSTGPSKGCILSNRYAIRHGELMVEHLGLRRDDVLYSPYPLFHVDATVLTVMPALVLGTTAAIGRRFSVSRFWDEVRVFGATVFDFMGATLTMLHMQEPRDSDRSNTVRMAWGVPMPDFAPEFEERFGVRLVEIYGSTDAGIPIYEPISQPRTPGSCGRVIDAYDARVVDEHDVEVANGTVGELVVRPLEPSIVADAYHGMPEATLESRRNLWFHTGDLMKRDDHGNFFFIGRRSDSIRRRGQNISAFEVEEVIKGHSAVLDAAAFGVPSELTEEDVIVAVVVRRGWELTPEDLVEFCEGRMARYMVPRYVDIVGSLPRTATEKVEKHRLRDRGVTATTWDREISSGGNQTASGSTGSG